MVASSYDILNSQRLATGISPDLNAQLVAVESHTSIFHRPSSPDLYQRSCLLKKRVNDCHHANFHTVLRIQLRGEGIEEKCQTIEKIQLLAQFLKENAREERIREVFDQVPSSYRRYFQWIIWIQNGMPSIDHYGKQALEKNIYLLNSQEKLIFLTEGNLAQQLVFHLEEELAIYKQKKVIDTFNHLQDFIYRPASDFSSIIAHLEELPLDIQYAIYYDVYRYSSHRRDEEDWGRKELYRNPNILKELRVPGSRAINLFEHHFNDQKAILGKMQTARELEQLERATMLYQTCSPDRVKVLLQAMDKNVSERLESMEKSEGIISFSGKCSTSIPHGMGEPLYETRGAHVGIDGTTFQVYAPNARSMTLLLTEKGVVLHKIPMIKGLNGNWEAKTIHAPHGRTYCYLLEDATGEQVYRTDPFSFSIEKGPTATESRVFNYNRYQWNDGEWIRQRSLSVPTEKPLSIYEVNIELWKRRQGMLLSYSELAGEMIRYCKEMKITHLLLYNVLDSSGGWGFHIHNYFSPNFYLGSTEEFQEFVDQLHQHGIHVGFIWVPAHYKHEPTNLSLHDWDGTNLYSEGICEWDSHLFDFSKPEVCALLEASALYWFEKLHMDFMSIDAVSHIVKRKDSAYEPGIRFLQGLTTTIKSRVPGALIIGEETTGFNKATESSEVGGLGLDVTWGIDLGWNIKEFLKTPYHERPEKHYAKLVHYLDDFPNRPKLLFSHSHDESANRWVSAGYPESNDKTLYRVLSSPTLQEKFSDIRNFFAWQIMAPSRGVLIHMGDEIGQPRSWDIATYSDFDAVQWSVLDPSKCSEASWHQGLQLCVRDLLHIYRERPAFWKTGEAGFRLCCEHADNNVIAYERSVAGQKRVYVVHNFTNKQWESYDIHFKDLDLSVELKGLKEIFNSNAAIYKGSGTYQNVKPQITYSGDGKPVYMTLQIPALSTMVFEET